MPDYIRVTLDPPMATGWGTITHAVIYDAAAVSHRVKRWAKLYHEWIKALHADDLSRSQRLMNVQRHAWFRLDEDERWDAFPYYMENHACHSS